MDIYKELYNIIKDRKNNPLENSYTNYLFNEGIDKIGKKVGEEAVELVIAAKNNNSKDIIDESADLIYHVLVMLVNQGVEYDQLVNELNNRQSKIKNLKTKNVKGEL